jgi:predicted anti-sigma-YlaC factor YlaD
VSCNSSEVLFEAYLDDTLIPAERARLLAHLNRCGSCKGVLAELRAVDALLASPREIALPPNFTFATMAEVRALPQPHVSPVPVLAYLVSYLAAAWLLIGAGFLLASSTLHAFGETALDISRELIRTFDSLGHAGARFAGDFGTLGTFVGASIVLDVAVTLTLILGFAVLRPRLAERLRS